MKWMSTACYLKKQHANERADEPYWNNLSAFIRVL